MEGTLPSGDTGSDPREWILLGVVALPFLAAALLPILARWSGVARGAGLVAVGVALVDLVGVAALWLTGGEMPVAFRRSWISSLGVDFAFRLDGLAFLFALMVTGIGLCIFGYSVRYIPRSLKEHRIDRKVSTFFACMLFFMGSMLGLVCADDGMTLYLFWEGTSISSFLLIGFDLASRRSRASANKAFTITAGAGLGLFVALLATARVTGTFSLSTLRDSPQLVEALTQSTLAPLILGGVLVAAVAKSAQLPLHVWLPEAMVAPTPVSAYLHSATMVAAGVFLLSRLAPVLDPIPAFSYLLMVVGALTLVFGASVALVQTGLKQILAFSTISQYGYVTLLLGLGAYGAALFVILAHAVIKAGLFLCAGLVTRATGKSDLRELGGLGRHLPVSAALTGILALGLAGVPLTSGFWMKELFYKGVLQAGSFRLSTLALLGGIATFAYMVRFWWKIFRGAEREEATGHQRHPIEPERALTPLLIATGTLAGLTLVGGVAPRLFSSISDTALGSVSRNVRPVDVSLHWPPDATLLLTIVTFGLGLVLVGWMAKRDRQLDEPAPPPSEHTIADKRQEILSPSRMGAAILRQAGFSTLYDRGVVALDGLSRFVSRVQSGLLLHYVVALAAVPTILGVVLLPRVQHWPLEESTRPVVQAGWPFASLAVAAVALAFASTVVRSQIGAVLMVGGVGYVLAIAFAILHAPDVAVVQVIVETVFAAFMLLVIGRLRRSIRQEVMGPRGRRSRAARSASVLVGLALGGVVAGTTFAVAAVNKDPMLGRTYIGMTGEAGADDVVATILVDFRQLDTFGEITVFAVAALGAGLLLARRSSGRDGKEPVDESAFSAHGADIDTMPDADEEVFRV